MNILFLVTQMERAGAQKAILSLAADIDAQGHQVCVVTMYDKGGCAESLQQEWNLPIVDLKMKDPGERHPLAKLSHFVRGLWRLRRLMRERSIDVLQTFSHYSNMIGPPVGSISGVPIRVSSQRASLREAPTWLRRIDAAVANSSCVHMMTAVSDATRRFCIEEEGIRPEKLLTIRNGINPQPWLPADSPDQRRDRRRELGIGADAGVVTTISRLHPQKGHRFLLDAAENILALNPACRFLIVGDGESRGEIEAAVRARGLQAAIHLLGVRSDIPQLLWLSDVFVLPSLWEGLPNVLLEAMAAGIPVVATDVDGVSEIVDDGKTGILIPPKDPDAIASAVNRLLHDEALADSLRRAARQAVTERFSPVKTTASYLELYSRLWGRERPANG